MKIKVRIAISFLLLTSALLLGAVSQALSSDTPTEAYKRLYAAVKSRDTEAIKQQMSKKSIDFGAMAARRNNTPLAKMYEHGFTATTLSDTLPTIRDERVKDDMGAVEVWNVRDEKWEDLPFVLEDGVWKLAVGDLFAGTFRSPGRGHDILEKEAEDRGKIEPNAAPTPLPTPKPPAPYKITAIKVVPFDEILGQFREPVDPEQWFGNDLSMSLFVTIELTGDAGGYVPKRNVQITVREGKKVKLSRIAYPGVFSEQGKYYVPVWLYGSMCDIVKITASVTGQKPRSSLSRTVNFHCGE